MGRYARVSSIILIISKALVQTALWMTTGNENDMPNRTEHGYAFTDHYIIEPDLVEKNLTAISNELHKRGMKLVQDAVYNHSRSIPLDHARPSG
jgi:glycosidase